jgi:uncharacterized membrane protein YfcA
MNSFAVARCGDADRHRDVIADHRRQLGSGAGLASQRRKRRLVHHAAFVGTAILGSLIAGHYGSKLDTGRLQHWFVYLVFTVAAYVLVDTIFVH